MPNNRDIAEYLEYKASDDECDDRILGLYIEYCNKGMRTFKECKNKRLVKWIEKQIIEGNY